ncbi:MAG: flagellar basal body rod protein FlgG [Gemmataceae bacterium]
MIKAFFTSATGMNAMQTVIDNTANNLANVNTTGFKRSQVDFQDLIYVTHRQPGTEGAQGFELPTGMQIGSGVRIAGTTKIFSAGTLDHTENPLDIAIEGEGFFQITLPNGQIRYTRDGAFRLNAAGNLVTSDGFLLEPPIVIPQDAVNISIGSDGTVSVVTSAGGSPTVVGTIQIARFPNPAGLLSEGRNLFSETAASGTPTLSMPGQNGTGLLRQGFLERSNVEVVRELVNLILAQRAYEFNTKAIKVADEMLASTNSLSR